MKTVDIAVIRDFIRIFLLLVSKAIEDGIERAFITKEDLYAYKSTRKIAKLINASHQTVGRLFVKMIALPLPLPDFDQMEDQELLTLFFPGLKARTSNKPRPPFALILKERQKSPKKMRKRLLSIFLREREKYGADNYLHRSWWFELVRRFLKSHKLEMKQEYEPGEVMFVDYMGLTVFVHNGGKKLKRYVFVAVLGYSKKVFACATPDMTGFSWVTCLIKAVEFYGGTTEVIHFDNAKAMVKKAGLLAEISDRMDDFARYYGNFCDTSRVGTPPDNANAEKGVQFLEDRDINWIREETFYSDESLNARLLRTVNEINTSIMQKYGISRDFRFQSEVLGKLPETPYQPYIKRYTRKVPANYLINYKGHDYSIPHQYCSKTVEIRITATEFIAYCGSKEVRRHKLSNEIMGMTRPMECMPESHQYEAKKNKQEFLRWAFAIGESVMKFVELQYKGHRSDKSRHAGKRCTMLKKLHKKYGEKLETACNYALQRQWTKVEDVELLLKSDLLEDAEDYQVPIELLNSSNLRGSEYYKGGKDV